MNAGWDCFSFHDFFVVVVRRGTSSTESPALAHGVLLCDVAFGEEGKNHWEKMRKSRRWRRTMPFSVEITFWKGAFFLFIWYCDLKKSRKKIETERKGFGKKKHCLRFFNFSGCLFFSVVVCRDKLEIYATAKMF